MSSDPARAFLRHTLATLAYRAAKVVRSAPPGFGATRACPTTRSAAEILAHMGDLFDWAVLLVRGEYRWVETPPGDWDADVSRFFEALALLDARLASPEPLADPPERLFQGPIADALTHVGQLATLRRAAGSPVLSESFYKAEIVVGRVGAEQAASAFEFE
jgi:hypothetical protein